LIYISLMRVNLSSKIERLKYAKNVRINEFSLKI
jgi:hypothetical protein